MTREERWVIVGLAWLILFGCGVERWRRDADAAGRRDCGPEDHAKEDLSGHTPFEAEGERTPPPPQSVDLNHCEAAELERLPGIGPVRAARIVEWREKHGPFRSAKELLRVPGVGPKTLSRIEPWIVGGKAAEESTRAEEPRSGGDSGPVRETGTPPRRGGR